MNLIIGDGTSSCSLSIDIIFFRRKKSINAVKMLEPLLMLLQILSDVQYGQYTNGGAHGLYHIYICRYIVTTLSDWEQGRGAGEINAHCLERQAVQTCGSPRGSLCQRQMEESVFTGKKHFSKAQEKHPLNKDMNVVVAFTSSS